MTGIELHQALLAHGARLCLNAQGQLRIHPSSVSQRYRSAIQEHLCYLLVCAAIAEVQRTLATAHLSLTHLRPMISTQMLDAACLGGDVATTRQAALTYVQAWQAWLKGDDHDERV